jgi:predicted HTH transcriptional regulator
VPKNLLTKEIEQLSLVFDPFSAFAGPDEIYRIADQVLLESIPGEDRRIERKPPGIHPKALGDYFSIWANTVPHGGLIVVGIENDGEISGCSSLSLERLNDLERSGQVYCPDARYESKRIHIVKPSGKSDFVLLIRVFYNDAKVVETVDGNAWTRLGESKKKLTAQEVRELQIDKGQVDFEREASTIRYPDGFDHDAIRAFADAVRKAGNLDDWAAEAKAVSFQTPPVRYFLPLIQFRNFLVVKFVSSDSTASGKVLASDSMP